MRGKANRVRKVSPLGSDPPKIGGCSASALPLPAALKS